MTDTRTIDLEQFTSVTNPNLTRPHFIGVAGVGMSALARAWSAMPDVEASGSDIRHSAITSGTSARLTGGVTYGNASENLPDDATCVIVSTAIPYDDPQLVAARLHGIPVIHRAQALSVLAEGKKLIAVCGTSGKSTTASMLTDLLLNAEEEPSHVVGATWDGEPAGELGEGDLFVIEADESDRSLQFLTPAYAIITNLGVDHVENLVDAEDQLDLFTDMALRMGSGGTLILNHDDDGCRELFNRLATLDKGPRLATYGQRDGADFMFTVTAVTSSTSTGTVIAPGEREIAFAVGACGEHMVSNAVAAIAMATQLDITAAEAANALRSFSGLAGRMTHVGEVNDIAIIETVAHNPGQIAADLSAAWKLVVPGRRVLGIFQPIGYARTVAHGEQIGVELARAEQVVLLPVHTTMSGASTTASLKPMADAILHEGGENVMFAETAHEAMELAIDAAEPGDVIVVMGVGPQVTDPMGVIDRIRRAADKEPVLS